MKLTHLSLESFRGVSTQFELPVGGKNLLIYGDNGSSKSSLSRALELLFDRRPRVTLREHQNFFVTTQPKIAVKFEGKIRNQNPTTQEVFENTKEVPVKWEGTDAKPSPPWLLSSSARSAFLDHRKLLLLSDRDRELGKAFFLACVRHLFAHLDTSAGKPIAELWDDIESAVVAFNNAKDQQRSSQEAASGVADPVARAKPIEDAANALNQALDDYLTAPAGQPSRLVQEAERLLGRFEHIRIKLKLEFEHITFNRNTGTLSGGLIKPTIDFCGHAIVGVINGQPAAMHHEFLNEARLTALALAIFFAAVRLQDQIPHVPGNGEPTEPARLLVLDDVLVGLDYDHRMPVLDIINEEFAANSRYQVILLTHNRVWFDICRLQMDETEWNIVELFAQRGKGVSDSDQPIRKQTPADYIGRAVYSLDTMNEAPAAANYVRVALEWALKEIAHRKKVLIEFRSDPERHDTEIFLTAIQPLKRNGTSQALVPLALQRRLKALRKTVLNPLSHFHPTDITPAQVMKAIDVASELVALATSLPERR